MDEKEDEDKYGWETVARIVYTMLCLEMLIVGVEISRREKVDEKTDRVAVVG